MSMYGRKPLSKSYMRALNSLYGDSDDAQIDMIPRKKRKKRTYDEDVEQIKFNIWFDKYLWLQDYRWFHVPNGGRRDAKEGAKFKRMGVKSGVPDIVCPMARKSYHGLVIELKRIDGVPSDVRKEQREWLDWFRRQGWSDHVAFGYEQAKTIVKAYFELA